MKNTITLAILFFAILLVPCADAQPAVRVIYFVPNDRPVQWSIPASLDKQIKAVQKLYADQMTSHGFGAKTFSIETGTSGKLIVHHITGKHGDLHYHNNTLAKINTEIQPHFDTQHNIYVVIVDVSTERIQGNCGIAYFDGGPAMFPASGDCVSGDAGIALIAHELGHAFNLEHDFRDAIDIMSYGANRTQLSKCAAAMLDVSPYFNTNPNTANAPASLQLLSPLTYSEDTTNWTLRFSVSDTDGIHQIQMLVASPGETAGIVSCKDFDNARRLTTEFQMPEGSALLPTNRVIIRAVDKKGNVQASDWTLNATQPTPTRSSVSRSESYLTLTHDSIDALIPTNPSTQWAGWREGIWERKPGKGLPRRPNGFMNPAESVQYYDDWEYFFYSHAESRIVYDLSEGNYTRFEAVFDMPNPCGSIASLQIAFLADGKEVYNSDLLRGSQARNTQIAFEVPPNTQELAINVTDGGDGNGCDHFILAEARLLHAETSMVETAPRGVGNIDVNRDGVVNLVDLVMVASRYGEKIIGNPVPNPDVNRDGVVDIRDITLITDELPIAAAPTLQSTQNQLLPNYPNPFNPETWIPYQLSKDTNVAIHIYTADGRLVRHLDLGFQSAGTYHTRSRAVNWDGRNALGERVASGVYFYTLTADDFMATRKMWIRK